jgi:penicillin-binding protein 1B
LKNGQEGRVNASSGPLFVAFRKDVRQYETACGVIGLKRSKLRFFSISLIILLLVTSAGLVFGSWYLKGIEDTVKAKFEGRKWTFPSKIYSDSYLLYVGMSLHLDDFWEKLRRLGYHDTKSAVKGRGEYRYQKSQGLLDIYLHDFNYPTERFKGVPVQIRLSGSVITKMENRATGKDMFSLELEPELVTGLYERIWQERRVVKLSEVPPLLIKAVLAIEDERFYYHHGVDPVSVLRAMWVNIRSGGVVQGGSTLTQQLMKNFFLGSERTLSRKFKEALMALVAERMYSKNEILENYLNEIYLGQRGSQGIFGVWEASQFYFSKPLSAVSECGGGDKTQERCPCQDAG